MLPNLTKGRSNHVFCVGLFSSPHQNKMSLSCKLQEAHYCALGQQSQSNVYGLAKVAMPCGQHKLLVASLRGKVSSMEFQKTRPRSKEVHFTYIPGRLSLSLLRPICGYLTSWLEKLSQCVRSLVVGQSVRGNCRSDLLSYCLVIKYWQELMRPPWLAMPIH